MNSDTLLTHIRLEQRCLIDIDKKLHELECLLSCSDPIRFFEVAKNTALLSERSTAQLRNFLFTVLRRDAAGLLSASCRDAGHMR